MIGRPPSVGASASAVALLLLVGVGSICAVQPSMNECFEASDFIRNAALARDTGMVAQVFLGHMEDDFVAIRAFPAELRWFAHDPEDELFLLAQARLVFDRPTNPDEHRALFLRACIDRLTLAAIDDPSQRSRIAATPMPPAVQIEMSPRP